MGKKYRHVGNIYKPEDDDSWIGWVIGIIVVLALMASCGG